MPDWLPGLWWFNRRQDERQEQLLRAAELDSLRLGSPHSAAEAAALDAAVDRILPRIAPGILKGRKRISMTDVSLRYLGLPFIDVARVFERLEANGYIGPDDGKDSEVLRR
jgi:hypothetical protein